MDRKHEVIETFNITDYGMLAIISDVEFGIKKGYALKSISSSLFWEVQERIIHSSNEKRFDVETEIFMHLNIRNYVKSKEIQGKYFEYKIEPIGHNEKPKIGDLLFVCRSIGRPNKLKIIDIYDEFFLLETNDGTGVLNKRFVGRNNIAKIGDFVQYCEHMIHDLVDENGNFIYRG